MFVFYWRKIADYEQLYDVRYVFYELHGIQDYSLNPFINGIFRCNIDMKLQLAAVNLLFEIESPGYSLIFSFYNVVQLTLTVFEILLQWQFSILMVHLRSYWRHNFIFCNICQMIWQPKQHLTAINCGYIRTLVSTVRLDFILFVLSQ